MNILIINGPNLNLLGKREPDIYGRESFAEYFERLHSEFSARGVALTCIQSNIEGELIDILQQADGRYAGIILNAGGYTHTSVAIADTIRAISTDVVEVHISNIFAREGFRHTSLTGAACHGVITGFGLESYRIAVESFMHR